MLASSSLREDTMQILQARDSILTTQMIVYIMAIHITNTLCLVKIQIYYGTFTQLFIVTPCFLSSDRGLAHVHVGNLPRVKEQFG